MKFNKLTCRWLHDDDELYLLLGMAYGKVVDYNWESVDWEIAGPTGYMHSLRFFLVLWKVEITWFT